jgi:DNA-3-methyladenine glycosylase
VLNTEFARDPRDVAPELLNKLIVAEDRVARIVEVEAYCGEEDPASHAYGGKTARNSVMFGPPGRLYVYFTYGMHWCANVVCGPEGLARAVLLRAASPVFGLDEMRLARPRARRDVDLCNGPAKLCQAMGIDGSMNGTELIDARGRLAIFDDGVDPPPTPGVGPRVGISAGTDLPWRWWVDGDSCVSAR